MVPDDEDIQDQQAIEAEHKAGNYNLRCIETKPDYY